MSQVGTEHGILLSQPRRVWDYRRLPSLRPSVNVYLLFIVFTLVKQALSHIFTDRFTGRKLKSGSTTFPRL